MAYEGEYETVEDIEEESDVEDEEEEEEVAPRKRREKKWKVRKWKEATATRNKTTSTKLTSSFLHDDKDPNKPKRAMSAFFLYSQAERTNVKANNPEASFGEV
jgi:HMG (high mobility group) box